LKGRRWEVNTRWRVSAKWLELELEVVFRRVRLETRVYIPGEVAVRVIELGSNGRDRRIIGSIVISSFTEVRLSGRVLSRAKSINGTSKQADRRPEGKYFL